MNNRFYVSKQFTRKLLHNTWFTALSILVLVMVVITSVAFLLPCLKTALAAPAGAPTLTVTPNSQPYFSQTKLRVQGTNYPTTPETVNIYWNYQNSGNPGVEEGSVTSQNGKFSFSFILPGGNPTGAYTIAALGRISGTLATTTFTLLPNLFVLPRATGVGSAFTITGQSYGANETVDIYWNCSSNCTGTPFLKATADSTGSFTATAHVPSGTYWKTPIFGIGENSGQSDTTRIIVYRPTLALAPLTGSAGTALTLTAYGFQSNEKVNAYWNNGSTPIFTIRTNTNGYMPAQVFTVPAGTLPGSYSVTMKGTTSKVTITNTFTVVASGSSLSASSGPVGMRVRVSGQGYAPGETVNIVWANNTPGAKSVATVQAGSSGTFHVGFLVPTNTGGSFTTTGDYSVAAIGTASNITTQNTFTVASGSVATPATSLNPGQNTTISAMGFQAGEKVKLYWENSSGTVLASTIADANGEISQAVNIPTTASPGSRKIVGVGVTSGLSFPASVTVDTMWNDFGFSPSHIRMNPFESSLDTTNVGNLQVQWNASLGNPQPEGAASPIYYNGLVYIATFDGKLNAYNATSGSVVWTFDTGTPFANLSSPVIDPSTGILYFGTLGFLENQDHGVPSPSYALDAQTGTLEWSEILNGDDYGFPTVAFNTIYVGLANEGNGSLLAIDEGTGEITGQYDAHSGVWGAVGVDTQQNLIFTGTGNPADEVLAFNATTFTGTNPQPLWTFKAAAPGADDDIGSAISVSNGIVYLDSKNGLVYALNESDGTQVWQSRIGANSQGNVSSLAIDTTNNILYVGSLNKNLYALNAQNGSIIWKVKTGGQIFSSPALANGVVYVASNDDNIYAFDASNGTQLWSYTTGAPTFSSPIIVNGWLYCASDDGNLYAFSL